MKMRGACLLSAYRTPTDAERRTLSQRVPAHTRGVEFFQGSVRSFFSRGPEKPQARQRLRAPNCAPNRHGGALLRGDTRWNASPEKYVLCFLILHRS